MKKEGIPFDGFGSVVEMLRRSDYTFREKILSGIRRRDPHLAQRLEAHLPPVQHQQNRQPQQRRDREEDTRAQLERSQRSAHTRNYGQ